jgi:hypothetical protein
MNASRRAFAGSFDLAERSVLVFSNFCNNGGANVGRDSRDIMFHISGCRPGEIDGVPTLNIVKAV